jgi:dipeptidyl aminopeptidase/acylaminoacyl peptidase
MARPTVVFRLFACLLGVTVSTIAPAETPIPLEDFFRNPPEDGFELSLDGRLLAYLAPWENRMNLHVRAVGERGGRRITSVTDRDIPEFVWKGDGRIVYLKDTGGDENYHLYAVNADGTGEKALTPFEGVKVEIIDDLEDVPGAMLIGMNRRDPRVFDAYRIDVVTGALTLVAENPGNIEAWHTDHEGRLRAATVSDGVNTSFLYRPTEGEPFQTILTTNFKDAFEPLLFEYDNETLYVASNIGRDKTAIVKVDPATARELQVVFEHDEVDVSSLYHSRKRRIVTGTSYYTDRQHFHFWDETRRNLQWRLEALLPGMEVRVTGTDRDETRYVARTFTDRTLGAYWLYDVAADRLEKLADLAPWLDEGRMASVRPISYRARDGLTIHGYLTLPPGVAPKGLPVVINPHGGPWARDYWGFNPEAQFLASRGFAVLQMNFRGSTGYGRAFWTAGFKEWGRKMQDDVTDGVQWLVSEGIADPRRVAIYGASYGGYAVLAGLAFTPRLYACGVDYVGVSNIFTLLETIPPYWELGRKMMYEMIGDPESEQELLRAASPVFHADRITAPLLVAQGANDPRVKKAESDQIVAALRSRGIEVEYLVKDDEGHGFDNEENRFDFYRAMERFLAACLRQR